MAYQPIFVRICDTNGCVQSHSCRHKVDHISIWANTENGEMFNGEVTANGGCLELGKNFTVKIGNGTIRIRLKKTKR